LLGDGQTITSNVPVAVAGGHAFSALTLSYGHSCGLAVSGKAYCWGSGYQGQLGDGSTDARSVPVAVSGGLTFSTLSADDWVTCGVTTAGTGYCWGWNVSGQLGTRSMGTGGFVDDEVEGSTTPVAIGGNLTLAGITLGYEHACGLTTSGAAYCWGWNGNGEFGNGAIERADYIWNPTAAAGGLTFSALDAGAYFTCGLTPAGKAYCWGGNFFGQVGSPPMTPWNQPSPVEVAGGHTFSAISVSWSHACGRTSGGTVYCWGLNNWGQLGNGGRTDEPGCGQAANTQASPYCSVPVKVAGQP
jgi:alpha-tubulin suppressor-like RCC1 family protein